MSKALVAISQEKEDLIGRCNSLRERLGEQMCELQDLLPARSTPSPAFTSPDARRLAFEIALCAIGPDRAASLILLARRIVGVAKMGRAVAPIWRRIREPVPDAP